MNALTALTRFGLGPNGSDLHRARADPRGYVLNQLAAPSPGAEAVAELPDLSTIARRYLGGTVAYRAAAQAHREMAEPVLASDDKESMVEIARIHAAQVRTEIFREEIAGRVGAALSTDQPLVERLVLFFSNHFAVGRDKPHLMVLAGHHERSLRPHVLGRFRDLLGAAILHPAMLSYLDNTVSVGPNSRLGQRTGRSYNENLARELLELHTLGVDGRYTEDDVVQLALVLTGWTGGFQMKPRQSPAEQILGEPFERAHHEPGPKTIFGRTYQEAGAAEIERVLDDLAVHPATARHISGKLARHFVGDAASAGLVKSMAATFWATDGDLSAVMETLVASEEAWSAPPAKVVPPFDLLVSSHRAFGQPFAFGAFNAAANALGYPFWLPPAPAGWPDGDKSWIGGDMLLERIDWASAFATRVAGHRESIEADAEDLLGDALDAELRGQLRRAEGRIQAMTILLMSPHWQLR